MDIPRTKQKNRRRFWYGGGALTAMVVVTVAVSGLDPAVPSVY